MFRPFVAALILWGQAAAADICQSTIEAITVQIDTETLAVAPAPTTRRERLLNFPARSFDFITRDQRACTSQEVFAFLAQVETVDDKCLSYTDAQTGFLLVPGPRNFRGRCNASTVCTRVNGTRDAVATATVAITDVALGTGDSTLSKVTHTTGAMVLSGTGATISGALGSAITGVTAAVGAPIALTAAAVTAVAVGGAIYICAD
ncbi:hypothetical protein [Loktanella sp. 3ANDIMAR09]|uniref:hypothetical protein n=1 Tax=Loktanella sp. 3ANDIMAR09 TaxID=1225657 RepID=UPI0012EDC8B6|nr:hypothetical protein [Loktanella sp. 3ANDIMAR09]